MKLLILLLISTSALADPKLDFLIDQAVHYSGYSRPNADPQVVELDIEGMSKLVCRGRRFCPLLGVYLDSDVIYIRSGLDENQHDSTLEHEIVHWLQHHSGKFDLNSCTDKDIREREAYNIQNQYIAEVQNSFQFVIPPPVDCN